MFTNGGVDYRSVHQIGFTGTAMGRHSGDILTVRGGVPLEKRAGLVVPYAAFTYRHLTQAAYTEQGVVVGGGNVFVVSGPNPSRDMVDYGIGLRMGAGAVQIDASYNGLARSTYLQQVGLLRARYLF